MGTLEESEQRARARARHDWTNNVENAKRILEQCLQGCLPSSEIEDEKTIASDDDLVDGPGTWGNGAVGLPRSKMPRARLVSLGCVNDNKCVCGTIFL
jgi:hypothetical protein